MIKLTTFGTPNYGGRRMSRIPRLIGILNLFPWIFTIHWISHFLHFPWIPSRLFFSADWHIWQPNNCRWICVIVSVARIHQDRRTRKQTDQNQPSTFSASFRTWGGIRGLFTKKALELHWMLLIDKNWPLGKYGLAMDDDVNTRRVSTRILPVREIELTTDSVWQTTFPTAPLGLHIYRGWVHPIDSVTGSRTRAEPVRPSRQLSSSQNAIIWVDREQPCQPTVLNQSVRTQQRMLLGKLLRTVLLLRRAALRHIVICNLFLGII